MLTALYLIQNSPISVLLSRVITMLELVGGVAGVKARGAAMAFSGVPVASDRKPYIVSGSS